MRTNVHSRLYKANSHNVKPIQNGMEVYVTDTQHIYYCEVGLVQQCYTNTQGDRMANVWFNHDERSEWLRFDQLAICH